MSPDKVTGPGGGAPLDSLSGAGASPGVEPKNEPSAFDKVMDKKDDSSHEHGDSRSEGKDVRAKDKDAKTPDKEMPLQDLSQFLRFRSQTMERPSGIEELKVDKALPRQVIDEVVQAVRVGVNKAGDKEMQFDLKSNVMDGLSIRVSIHDNKVVTILEASTLDVKHRLESGLSELMHNLEQRGLPVADVEIKFREEPRRQQDQSSRQQRQYQEEPDESEDES